MTFVKPELDADYCVEFRSLSRMSDQYMDRIKKVSPADPEAKLYYIAQLVSAALSAIELDEPEEYLTTDGIELAQEILRRLFIETSSYLGDV